MSLLINGELIDDAVIREEVAALRPKYEAMVPMSDPIAAQVQLWEWSRENVIERTLLRQESWKTPDAVPAGEIDAALKSLKTAGGPAGCLSTQSDAELRQEIESRLRLEHLIQRITGKVGRPKYKEIGEYYRQHKEEFRLPETIHAAHIVKNVEKPEDEAPARAVLEGVQQKLKEGAAFAELADAYSDCPGRGGDLGWFPRGDMVEEFDEVVFGLPLYQPSEIFRSVFGWHIAVVHERRPAGYRGLEEVKDEIERRLLQERQQKAIEDFVDRLKAKAKIESVSRAKS